MTRIAASSIVAAGCLAAGLALTAAEPSSQQTPVFRAGVDLAMLEVRVLDADGRPVKGLGPDDFTVELDGRKTPVRVVDYFEFAGPGGTADPDPPVPSPGRASPRPVQLSGRSVLVLIDEISFGTQQTPAFLADARHLITGLGPNDGVGVGTTTGEVVSAGITRDKTRAVLALRSITGRRADGEDVTTQRAMTGTFSSSDVVLSNADALAIQGGSDAVFGDATMRLCGRRVALANAGAGGQCAVAVRSAAMQQTASMEHATNRQFDNMRQMIAVLRESPAPRLLIVMSAGIDTDADHAHWLGALQSEAVAAGIQVHVFMPGLGSGNEAADRSANRSRIRRENDEFGRRGLELVAGRLNADVYRIVGTPGLALDRVLTEWSGSYRVGVDPPANVRRAGPVSSKVTVRRSGVSVRTPPVVMLKATGGTAANPAPGADVPAASRSTAATLAHLVDDGGSASEVSLALGSISKRDEAGHDVQVVTIEVPATVTGPLSGLFAAFDSANQVIQRGTLTFPPPAAGDDHRLSIVVPIAPGGYRLRVAVSDATGAAGVTEHTGVARLSRLRSSTVSDLFLSWVGDNGQARFVAMEAVPALARTLQASVELYSTADPSGTTVKIALIGEGKTAPLAEVVAAPVKTPSGWRAGVSVPLASLEAGVYAVRATVAEGTDPPLVISRTIRKLAPRTGK